MSSRREPFVLVPMIQAMIRTGIELGLARRELLTAAGLTEAELASPDARLPFRHQQMLGMAMQRARPDVDLGLFVLNQIDPTLFGVLAYALRNCESLADAYAVFVRLQGFFTNAARWNFEREAARLTLEAAPGVWTPEAASTLGPATRGMTAVMVHLGRALTGTYWSPERVELACQPSTGLGPWTALFGCPVSITERNVLHLSPETLRLPIDGARPELLPSLISLVQKHSPERELPEWTERVRETLSEGLARGACDRPWVARALKVSERSLARHLSAEGTSFQDVLDDLRRSRATAWLHDRSLTVYQVAFLLGYSEPSTFHRAFRRWTGVAPDAWRRTL